MPNLAPQPFKIHDKSPETPDIQNGYEQRNGWRVPRRLGALLLTGTIALSTLAVKEEVSSSIASAQTVLSTPIAPDKLDSYITNAAKAWEPYVAEDGHLVDPLDPTNSGNGYGVGVIMLADVMLQSAARDSDESLVQSAEHIIGETSSLNTVAGTFNLLAIDMLLRHGQAGKFPAQAWEQIASPVSNLAARVESTITEHGCLSEPSCYSNWRLVWSAGAGALLASGVHSTSATGNSDPAFLATQINTNLKMAVSNAGEPVRSSIGGPARELSDPLSKPSSYHIFSSILLEMIAEQAPQAMTPAVRRLRADADRYALDMMAPDGQLSMAGRSLNQSWVQAAAADLGARRALEDPTHAAEWRSFADRAFSYLLTAYPARADGIVPIVPGLVDKWDPNIMDSYAHLTHYGGLTLWFLNDALAHWPRTDAPRGSIPADYPNMLVDDLRSSGLVWGRSGHVWWELSGRRTSLDPRHNQGVVDVKVENATGWQDLLALRPIQPGLSSAWTLTMPGGDAAIPVFTRMHGSGHHVSLAGKYRKANGKVFEPTTWTLTTTEGGIKLNMTKPRKALMRTTIWQPRQSEILLPHAASAKQEACTVSASGQACPTTLRWLQGDRAVLKIGT